jgi:oxygen-independent coproporphyrinogen-3 oxidase
MRHKSPKAYLAAAASGDFVQTDEPILPVDLTGEFMMNALRLNEGFGIELYERYTGLPWLVVSRQVDTAVRDDFLEWAIPNKHLRPTIQGRRFLNVLLQRFL